VDFGDVAFTVTTAVPAIKLLFSHDQPEILNMQLCRYSMISSELILRIFIRNEADLRARTGALDQRRNTAHLPHRVA